MTFMGKRRFSVFTLPNNVFFARLLTNSAVATPNFHVPDLTFFFLSLSHIPTGWICVVITDCYLMIGHVGPRQETKNHCPSHTRISSP